VEFEGKIGVSADGTLWLVTGYFLEDVKGHCVIWPYELNRASAEMIV